MHCIGRMGCRCSTFAPNMLPKYGIWQGEEYGVACGEHADEREAIRRQVLADFRAHYGAELPQHLGRALDGRPQGEQALQRIHGTEIRRISAPVGQAGRSDSWHMDDGANALIPARPSISTTLTGLTTLCRVVRVERGDE